MPETAHTVLIVAMTVMVMTFSESAQSCVLKLLTGDVSAPARVGDIAGGATDLRLGSLSRVAHKHPA
jgi:hypothetical protein